jgi:integrin beta 8
VPPPPPSKASPPKKHSLESLAKSMGGSEFTDEAGNHADETELSNSTGSAGFGGIGALQQKAAPPPPPGSSHLPPTPKKSLQGLAKSFQRPPSPQNGVSEETAEQSPTRAPANLSVETDFEDTFNSSMGSQLGSVGLGMEMDPSAPMPARPRPKRSLAGLAKSSGAALSSAPSRSGVPASPAARAGQQRHAISVYDLQAQGEKVGLGPGPGPPGPPLSSRSSGPPGTPAGSKSPGFGMNGPPGPPLLSGSPSGSMPGPPLFRGSPSGGR